MNRPTFWQELKQQRWDDHRFYHQSRVNQTFHLLSALCFLTTYVLLFIDPVIASLFGWFVAMWPRQIGHFFFEPKGYDRVNDVTFEHKEEVKTGYNLQRKVTLFVSWLSIPAILWFQPALFGIFSLSSRYSFLQRLALVWLVLAVMGLILRTLWLCTTQTVQTGLVWFTKILTDPFHDVKLYHMAPVWLLRGQWLDPMEHVQDSH